MAEEDDSHTLEVLATLKDTPAAMLSRGIIKKNACVCQYDYATHLVEILVMKGSFWKNMGFSSKGKNYLYPEEALYLFELDRLCIQSVDGKEMTVKSVFSTAVGSSELSLASYLVFTKLKTLDYIVFRRCGAPKAFSSEEIAEIAKTKQGGDMLNAVVAYDIWLSSSSFSKTRARELPPLAHVVICTGSKLFPPKIILSIVSKAHGVPVIFAAVSPNGYVLLEEFTDAEISIDWNNLFAESNTILAAFSSTSSRNVRNTDEIDTNFNQEASSLNIVGTANEKNLGGSEQQCKKRRIDEEQGV